MSLSKTSLLLGLWAKIYVGKLILEAMYTILGKSPDIIGKEIFLLKFIQSLFNYIQLSSILIVLVALIRNF